LNNNNMILIDVVSVCISSFWCKQNSKTDEQDIGCWLPQ
jgi:hypothetical protein